MDPHSLVFLNSEPVPTGETVEESDIHIRLQQRKGRSYITTVEGINPLVDKRKILGVLKRKLNCNGTVVKDEEHGEILQMQGDQTKGISDFLISEKLATKEKVFLHGQRF